MTALADARRESADALHLKRDGVVFTPDDIARFVVARTLGRTLDELRAPCVALDGAAVARAAWRAHLAARRRLRSVDPACGAGVFLLAAFDALAEAYGVALARLASLGEVPGIDPEAAIPQSLFGVDLDPASAAATRRALWLKARRRLPPARLEATIRTGDSLIADATFTARPLDWRAAFPEVFEAGGFDVVIGNPPYVRMELLKAIKPYLERHYAVAARRADLSAYFFERGVALLKVGGRLGYISSSTFFRTGAGATLRALLAAHAVESVVDFGDLQLFGGVTTYPAIVTLRKGPAFGGGTLDVLKLAAMPPALDAAFAAARPMPRARLGRDAWRFEDDALAALRGAITCGRPTLREVYGPPLYGIKTGLNRAFVVDAATRDRLVAKDPRSAELLAPLLRGEDIGRWRVAAAGLFLIDTPKGRIDIDAFPAIRDWLAPFRPALEARATRQAWFELQQAQCAYRPGYAAPKIIYGHFARARRFAFDAGGYLANDKCYVIPGAPFELLALLNSKAAWFVLAGLAPAVRGGFRELRVQYVERLPIPDLCAAERRELAELGARCVMLARSGRGATPDIADAERAIDAAAARAFGLTPAETARLEAAVA